MASVSISKTPEPVAPSQQPIGDKLIPAQHTLPASWWTSEKVFEFEKRAIFNKSWLFCIHSSRFQKAGDYFSFTFTGLNFFIIKSKVDGTLKAFHNVCRHRAYPVVRKEEGSSTILGCRYHGWSYDTEGTLKKAPHFDKIEGFKKEENSLFPISTHVTEQGLVFVNFCNQKSDHFVPFDKWFDGLETELHEFDFDDYEYSMSYELDGQFNWKTLMDGYQECYHCPTAHPGLNSAFKMETYKVVPKSRYCRHYAEIFRSDEFNKKQKKTAPSKEKDSSWFNFGKSEAPEEPQEKQNPGGEFNGLWVYLFPTNGVNCYSPAWYSIRVLPISATHTILHYDIYTKKGSTESEKKEFIDFLKLVELEDFNLCELTQKNLNQGIYSNGYLHPTKENGVLYYQGVVREMVKDHFQSEQRNGGRPINPASLADQSMNKEIQELEDICNSIECQSGSTETKLEW